MNLLYLLPHASTGGMPAFNLRRIESLINEKDINIFVVEYQNVSNEYTVHKNKIINLLEPGNYYTLGENKYEILDILINNKIDIIHIEDISESNNFDIDVISNIYSNDRTWKIIETCHNSKSNDDDKLFLPDAYANCSLYQYIYNFNNKNILKELIEYPIIDKSNYNKADAYNILNLDPNKKHVINIGLWTPNKNQLELIEIARELENNTNIEFHLVGNMAENFKDYWSNIGYIPKNVKIWGEREDVHNFYMIADLLLFNSLEECNPITIKEALSYGIQIMCRDLKEYMYKFSDNIHKIDDNINLVDRVFSSIYNPINYKIKDELIEFKDKHIDLYNKVLKSDKVLNKLEFNINHINGTYLEIKGASSSKYKVIVCDNSNNIIYQDIIKSNMWINLNIKYYIESNIYIFNMDDNSLIYEYKFNLSDKKVLIQLDSKALGDTLAWLPYIEDFKDKNNCELYVSTYMNYLFENTYNDINFIEPGEHIENIYAKYTLGWFYKGDDIDYNMHPNNFREQPLQKTSSDILGLDFIEKRVKLDLRKTNVRKTKKSVAIAIHSTMQAKYWNNTNGWQDVVDHLNNIGYDVILYSNEPDGYMGNNLPKNINKFIGGNIQDVINDMITCDFFIGIGSGLTWLAWSIGLPVILISGFSDIYTETIHNTYRVINKDSSCNGCFNKYKMISNNWNWCPINENNKDQFICTKSITSEMVISKIDELIYNI